MLCWSRLFVGFLLLIALDRFIIIIITIIIIIVIIIIIIVIFIICEKN